MKARIRRSSPQKTEAPRFRRRVQRLPHAQPNIDMSHSGGGLTRGQARRRIIKGSQVQATLQRLMQDEPEHVGELAERMRQDYQIQLAELVLGANIRTAQVSVNVTTHTQERLTSLAAEYLKEHLQQLWDTSLKSMMQAIGDGRVAYEKVWDWDDEGQVSYIRKLEDLPFGETEMQLWGEEDEDLPDEQDIGSFKGIKLDDGTGEKNVVELDEVSSWWLALDPTSTEPHGKSRYLGAPQAVWEQRQDAIKLRGVFIKRFCLGGGIVHAPETIELEDGTIVDVFEEIAKAYDDLLSGGLLCMPNDRERNSDGSYGEYIYDFSGAELDVKDGTPLTALIQAMDDEQLLSFGILPQTIQSEGVGSFAMVSQHMLTMFSVIEDLVSQFVESFEKYVAQKSVEMNFDPGQVSVELTFQKLTERPDDLAVELVRTWLTTTALSPILLSGAVDVVQLLDLVGVPVTDNAQDRVRGLLSVAAAADAAQRSSETSNAAEDGGEASSGGAGGPRRRPPGPSPSNRRSGENGRQLRNTPGDRFPFLKLER